MTTVEKIEAQLEPQLAELTPAELRELAYWLVDRVTKAAGKAAEGAGARGIDPEVFSASASAVLEEHKALLEKLAQ